jgi:hypothetical protein
MKPSIAVGETADAGHAIRCPTWLYWRGFTKDSFRFSSCPIS